MADILVKPGLLSGTVTPPPAKSDAHRALIAATMSDSRPRVGGLPEPLSEDLSATVRCLDALGAGLPELDCGESGTTLRLLIPVCAALPPSQRADPLCFTGRGRLPYRPLKDYEAILGPAGVHLQFPAEGFLPLTISGRLEPGDFFVPGHISSQYVSGLLLALPLLGKPSRIHLTSALESAPYVAMTIRTLQRYGIEISQTADGFAVLAPQPYRASDYMIEKDYSQAAFWLTAAYGGAPLTVSGLPADTAQGDKAIEDWLGRLASGRSEYEIDAAQIPDLVPILAVAACLTKAETRIVRAGRLRLKESDRLEATASSLRAIGAAIEAGSDSLTVHGGRPLPGGQADACGDHRIAMALAIAALFTRTGVLIRGAEAVRKSYPDFFQEMRRLGGDVHELHVGDHPEDQLVW